MDPTTAFQRGSLETLYFPSYGRALVLRQGSANLEIIPLQGEQGKIYCEENYFIPDSLDRVKLEVRTAYTGSQADAMRSMLAFSGNAQMKENYLDYYARLYTDIVSTAPLKVTDDVRENKLTVTEYYQINGFLRKDTVSNIEYLSFYANLISQQLPAIAASRKHPVAVNYPYNLDYKIRLIAKKPWNVPDDNFSIKRDAYFFHMYHSRVEDTTTLHYQFAFLKPFIPTEKAGQLAADVRKLSDEKLGYNITLNSSGSLNISWGAVLFSLLLTGLLAWLACLIYRRRTFTAAEDQNDQPSGTIGGWMILPMIGLFATPVVTLWQLLSTGYYNRALWQGIAFAYPTQHLELNALLMFEIAANLFLGTYAVLCLVAMFNRRDIFPRLVIIFYVVNMVVILLDYSLIYLSALPLPVTASDAGDIMRAVVGGAIWISYFRVSSRVKATFTVPYPRAPDTRSALLQTRLFP